MSFHSAYMCYRLLCERFKRSEQQGATLLLPSALNNVATMISTNFQALIENYVFIFILIVARGFQVQDNNYCL